MKLLGNRGTVESFRDELSRGKLSHAFIIEGARGSGRLTLARTLASLLVCERGREPDCGCTACSRAMSGTHPDIYEIIHLDKTSQIKIDQIRTVIEKAHIKPSEAEYKVFIIENAQMMNGAAQNALLQIFEEPPQNTLFFLLSTDRNLLLKTLLSRARVIKTERLDDGVIEKFLKEKFPDKTALIPRAVQLSAGFAGDALALLENDASPEMLELAVSYFEKAAKGASLYELAVILSPFKKSTREEFASLLGYFIPALRDVIMLCAELPDLRLSFFTDSDTPRILGERLGIQKAMRIFDFVSELQRYSGSMNLSLAAATLNSYFASDIK